jgi:hypothetical protein
MGIELGSTFESKINKTPECWLWTAAKNPSGYGRFSFKGKLKYPHRLMFESATGKKIPPKMEIAHKCDNPSCVNPNHLFLATRLENTRDCIQKGRFKSNLKHTYKTPLKKYCKRGHDLSEGRVRPSGARACRKCKNLLEQGYRKNK